MRDRRCVRESSWFTTEIIKSLKHFFVSLLSGKNTLHTFLRHLLKEAGLFPAKRHLTMFLYEELCGAIIQFIPSVDNLHPLSSGGC